MIFVESMVMVFGANEQGIHGAGAALYALKHRGAVLHQGFGPQGNSFGIPTCALPVGRPGWKISIEKIAYYDAAFILYAKMHPEKKFQVTQIGCGFVGFTPAQMAPLFAEAPANCLFDSEWSPYLPGRLIWGHV